MPVVKTGFETGTELLPLIETDAETGFGPDPAATKPDTLTRILVIRKTRVVPTGGRMGTPLNVT
jgi:hypothetical protein